MQGGLREIKSARIIELIIIIIYNNALFKYIYAHKQDTRCVFEKADHEVIPIKGPLTKL